MGSSPLVWSLGGDRFSFVYLTKEYLMPFLYENEFTGILRLNQLPDQIQDKTNIQRMN
jgi:hypothetical protein